MTPKCRPDFGFTRATAARKTWGLSIPQIRCGGSLVLRATSPLTEERNADDDYSTVFTEAGNRAILDGTLEKVIGSFIEKSKPDACYFTVTGGKRTAYFFTDLSTSSDMPVVGEEFFL